MNTQLIKQDRRGRTWRSAEVRRELIEAFRMSGESAVVFCSERGIKLTTFYNWLAKERKVQTAPAFQEVQMPAPSPGREVRVCLPNRVEVCIPVDSSAELSFNRENFNFLLEKERKTATVLEGIQSENDRLRTEVKLLNEKVRYLINKVFGRSSEKLNPDQMELLFEELRETHDALDEATEELDVTPTRFFKRIIVRENYVKVADRSVAPVIAPAPKKLIPNSYASAGLIRYIILNKYCDHLLLYRQEMALKYRHDIEISRKTMGNWMYLIADWLALIYEALRKEIRESGYMQIDETYIRYQDPQKDRCPNGYLWAYNNPGIGVLFEWFPSRATACLDPMLSSYGGYIQTDGYVAYPSWLNQPGHKKEKDAIIHAACWAHARRNFVEVTDNSSSRKIVKLIARLYRTEAQLREHPELERSAYRQGQVKAPVPVG